MDMTPGLDSDPHLPSSHTASIPYSHASAGQAAQAHYVQDVSMQQGQSSGQPKISNGPHIRSRITVVCAECKRLKLKCDRRTPCGSCLKRDTVSRCVYSQAAAEKIDVQSLHNRLLVLESALARMSEAPQSTSVSSLLNNIGPFKPRFTSSTPPNTTHHAGPSQVSTSTNHFHGGLLGQLSTDRAMLAVGASGSSVVISVEEFSSIWLSELEDFNALDTSPSTPGPSSAVRVKLEPTPVLMPPLLTPFRNPDDGGRMTARTFVPPIPYEIFLPSTREPTTHVSTPANPYPPTSPQSTVSELPQVTPALLARLPPAETRPRYMKALAETMMLHPCFNVRHFEQRIDAMFVWAESGSSAYSMSVPTANGGMSIKALAQDVFFGKPGKPSGKEHLRAGAHQGAGNAPKPTLSFFAAATAAFALGALVCRSNAAGRPSSSPRDSSVSSSPVDGTEGDEDDYRSSPPALFALSEQALSLFEQTALYDLDAVIAMILHILYHLHDGQMSVAQGVFPLVGKMINVARMMGLAIDPDEFTGTYSLFEAETRRRIWWDVFYYDLFISDCMGQLPLIGDSSFTTRLPGDVDEEQFGPSSTSLPNPPAGEAEKGTAYFALKCRLAQLVKNVKKQTAKESASDEPSELTIDQAAAFEGEVTSFLADLPPAFRLELPRDWTDAEPPASSGPPFLQAQKCELAILANRLILKLYLPFLKENGLGSGKPPHQAVYGTINAAHLIIYASRMLHAVWRQTRPAAFDFYDFGRTLFDAAVVCAHAVIQDPTGVVAPQAMKGVGYALDVLKDLGASRGGVEGVRGEGNRSEAIRIVEIMKRRAEAARSSSSSSSSSATTGVKRKRSTMDDERLASGFHLPFVGSSVSSVKCTPASPSKSLGGAAKDGIDGRSRGDHKKQAREKDREKEKAPKYPSVDIRARANQGTSSGSRHRTASVSSNAPPPSAGGRVGTATPSLGPPPSSSHGHGQPGPSYSTGVPESPRVIGYETPVPYSARPPPTPSHDHVPRDDYPQHYGSSGEESAMVDRRRFSSQSFADSPQAASMFDQASMSQQSPTSYTTGPTPPYYSYPPPSAPPTTFEHPAVGHSHSLPPMAGLPPPTTMQLDAPTNESLAMSTMTDQPYMSYEKNQPQYASHMGGPSDHARQLTQGYQPPPSAQAMSMGNTNSWLGPPNGGGEMWNDYKYLS